MWKVRSSGEVVIMRQRAKGEFLGGKHPGMRLWEVDDV
jgi:hypothetical protein